MEKIFQMKILNIPSFILGYLISSVLCCITLTSLAESWLGCSGLWCLKGQQWCRELRSITCVRTSHVPEVLKASNTYYEGVPTMRDLRDEVAKAHCPASGPLEVPLRGGSKNSYSSSHKNVLFHKRAQNS